MDMVYILLISQLMTMLFTIVMAAYVIRLYRRVKEIPQELWSEDADCMEVTGVDATTVIDKDVILESDNEVQKEAYLAMIANVEEDQVATMSRKEMLQLQLRTLIEQEKIYLKAGLKLEEVAITLGTNRTYVTKMMMEIYQHTFSEQMNIFRLQSAQHDLVKRSEASIEDIALSNGFNSSNTFNKVFNQHYGCSPATWRAQHSD